MAHTTWQNWSGAVTCRPVDIIYPTSVEEIVAALQAAGREGYTLRPVGSGHSFTPLAVTDARLLSLDHFQGVESVDVGRGVAVVRGGTKLKALGAALRQQGVAQENLGDIDAQSIAGAISTGTHGTGLRFPGLAAQTEALTLVTAGGEVVECSADHNPELFKAAAISLGSLGIIARLALRVIPAFNMRYISRRATLDHCLENLTRYQQEHRHFEFYWFPYSPYTQLKLLDETSDAPTPQGVGVAFNKVILENVVLKIVSEACRFWPRLTPAVGRLAGRLAPTFEEVNASHRVLATVRWVRFNEMEYNIPLEAFPETIRAIQQLIERRRFAVHFPIECRFVRGDDRWLSPAYGRDSAYIAVHMYKGMPHEAYFRAVEEILQSAGGRPHWGKMHTMTPTQLADRYPRWHDFLRLRAQLDPDGRLLNPYLRRLFGLDASPAGV